MTDIILSTQNGEPVASSLQIAESFEKRHDHVMRGIEDILRGLPKNGDTPMFYKTEYTHEQNGQTYPMYLMNRDGFSLLVMGFTGKAALEWKLKYIQAFNEMEKKLSTPQMPKLSKELQALFLLDDRTQRQEQRITALENNMVVDYDQQLSLKNAVNTLLWKLWAARTPRPTAIPMCGAWFTARSTRTSRCGSGSAVETTFPASALTRPWSTSSAGAQHQHRDADPAVQRPDQHVLRKETAA